MKKKLYRERYIVKVETLEEKVKNPTFEMKEDKLVKRGRKNAKSDK